MKRHKTVDEYLANETQWHAELVQLRKILNSTALEETVKWGAPCYTVDGKNVVGIGAFKSYFGLWFFQGALMSDDDKVLINAQEGKTKGLRQWRMSSKTEIKARAIKAYVKEAIDLQRSGQQIKVDRTKPLVIPPELEQALGKSKKAQAGFAKLTKAKQRDYAEYISEAKRAETKKRRLQKIIPMIQRGGGLNDKYRNC